MRSILFSQGTNYVLQNMSFGKKIRYESRKQLAEARPRVKGQFVRADSLPQGSAGEQTGHDLQTILYRSPQLVWRSICALTCIAGLQIPLCRQACCPGPAQAPPEPQRTVIPCFLCLRRCQCGVLFA